MTSLVVAAALGAVGCLCLSTGRANQWRIWRYQIGAVACFIVALLCLADSARAHEPYSDWKMPDAPNTSCCNDSDCRPVRAESDMDGNWTAFVDGRRVPIPARKVMKIQSPDGRSHWCGVNETTYCFVPAQIRG